MVIGMNKMFHMKLKEKDYNKLLDKYVGKEIKLEMYNQFQDKTNVCRHR